MCWERCCPRRLKCVSPPELTAGLIELDSMLFGTGLAASLTKFLNGSNWTPGCLMFEFLFRPG